MSESVGVVRFFQEGGMMMYVQLLLFIVSLPVGVVACIVQKRIVALVVVALAGLVLLAGVGGWLMGRSATDAAIAHVSPEDRAMIQAAGYAESARNLQLGMPAGGVIFALGAVAFALAGRKEAQTPRA